MKRGSIRRALGAAALGVALAFAINWIAFIPAYLLKTEKFYDLTGSITYITVVAVKEKLQADDIAAACERVREYGGQVTREPGPMKHGSTVIAFVEDPDGYKIEFIER